MTLTVLVTLKFVTDIAGDVEIRDSDSAGDVSDPANNYRRFGGECKYYWSAFDPDFGGNVFLRNFDTSLSVMT